MEISIGMDGGNWASTATALAAMITAIVAPPVTIWAARHQARRSIVSSNRNKWIDELRSEVVAFISCCAEINLDTAHDTPFRNKLPSDEKRSLWRASRNHLHQIELRLNPWEGAHNDFLETLEKCSDAAVEGKGFKEAKQATMDAARTILKSEWEAVKRGA